MPQDGEIAARTAKLSGLHVARGSVGSGGLSGLKTLHRMVRKDNVSVLSVADGSRGPVYQAQAGVIVLAQTAKAPLVPISCEAASCWRLKSWDRMIVPKPFSRIAVAIGEPIEYLERLDKDRQARAQAEVAYPSKRVLAPPTRTTRAHPTGGFFASQILLIKG